MSEPVAPQPITPAEPVTGQATDVAHPRAEPAGSESPTRTAARRVLARDGLDFHLQPWQVAYLVATSEGREGLVPPGCGVGKGWLQARLDEVRAADAQGD